MNPKRLFSTFFNRLMAAVMLVTIVWSVTPASVALAASAGPNYADSGATSGGAGTNWTNPGNITADDTSYATVALTGNANSEYLLVTDFDFAIPTAATINGIQVEIAHQSSSTSGNDSVQDRDLYLRKTNANVGTDHASSNDWQTTMQVASYGATNDLWGTTWTPAEINATTFGVALSVENESNGSNRTGSVDYIRVTVTYTINRTVTVTTGSGGAVHYPYGTVVNGAVSVPDGSSPIFSFVPATGYIVADVLANGVSVGRVNSHTLTPAVTTDTRTIAATFDGGWSAPSNNANSGWQNSGDAYSSNNARAIANQSTDVVQYYNFNIPAIPGTSTITGIEIAIEGYAANTRELEVSLSWNNGTSYSAIQTTAMVDGGVEATHLLGGSGNTWGRTWAATDFTNANFRVRLDATLANGDLFVDQVQVKVHYADPAPTVVSIVRVGASPTATASVQYTVTFNEAVTGVSATNFALVENGVSGTAITGVNGSGTTWTVTANTGTGDGTLGLNMNNSTGITDSGGSALSNLPFTGEVYVVDKSAPTVTSITRANPNPTNATSVDFTVNFSEAVSGVVAADFTLVESGVSGTSITGVTGSGATWTVTVNTGTGDGTLGLDMTSGTSVGDGVGNPLSSLPVIGELYTVRKTAPLVMSIVRADPNPTTTSSVTFTVTISADVTGVSSTNFTLAATSVTGASITSVTGSGTTYTVVVATGTGEGTVGLDMDNSTGVADGAGNALGNTPFTGEVYTIDLTAPLVTLNGINSVPDSGNGRIEELEVVTVGVTQLLVTFNEDVNNAGGGTGVDDVTNPANYRLVKDNGDGIQTVNCAAPIAGGDFVFTVDSVTYANGGGSGPFVATLNVNGGTALTNGVYRLIVCGSTSITDLAGTELAGDGTTAGTDFIRNFVMAVTSGGSGSGTGTQNNNSAQEKAATSGALIPVTGFPMGKQTKLSQQPLNKAYASYGDLWLEIPSLNVKMNIVGIPKTDKSWDVTWLGKDAGWLSGSAFPTLEGNTVLTAHVWDALNQPGPFYGLKNLRYGDKVMIHAWGKVYTYEVRTKLLVLPSNLKVVMQHEELDWITLVTCESFNPAKDSYTYRRLVRAVLVSVTNDK